MAADAGKAELIAELTADPLEKDDEFRALDLCGFIAGESQVGDAAAEGNADAH